MGPGNTEKQLRFMKDMKTTVLCATSSYALLLAEEIAARGVRDELALRKGVLGLNAGAKRCAIAFRMSWVLKSMTFTA